jgi:hypothetical protein
LCVAVQYSIFVQKARPTNDVQNAVFLSWREILILQKLHAEHHRLLQHVLTLAGNFIDELAGRIHWRYEILENVIFGLDVLDRVVFE